MNFTCEHCGKPIGCVNTIHEKKIIHLSCLEDYVKSIDEIEEDIEIEEFGRCTLTHISKHEKEQANSEIN